MPATIVEFRSVFTEFSDSTQYPDPMVQFYLTLAGKLLLEGRWGDILNEGIYLYVAHNLSIQKLAQQEAEDGNAPGSNSGVLSSKSVDKVSAGFDTSSGKEDGAGSYNLTTYGARLYRLIQIVGAGPIQVGANYEGSTSTLVSAAYYYNN